MVWHITQVEPILALTVQIVFNVLHTPSVLVRRALPSSADPLVPELQSSLKSSAYSLEKKGRDVDALNECATPWP